MKIKIDLGNLWRQVHRVSDDVVDIGLKIGQTWAPPRVRKFKDQLQTTGVNINLEDITTKGGLLSYRGQHVLLYIPDHGMNIANALREPGAGKKFHLAECRTIKQMREINRYARYVATTNTSGLFRIVGVNEYRQKIEGNARLYVCKNCLHQLNYKGIQSNLQYINVKDFNIKEFFDQYASAFFNPREPSEVTLDMTGYTSDWPELSKRVRKAEGWKCRLCGLDLKEHKNLLHVHHANGIKNDNSQENLVPLCASCHRSMPLHQHITLPLDDLRLLNKIRYDQGIFFKMTWRQALKFADPAFHYALMQARKRGWPVPKVYEQLENGEILDLAWPTKKVGVTLSAEAHSNGDWDIWDFDGFSRKLLGF